MTQVEIHSGPATVIASGTVISFKGNPVAITLGPVDDRMTAVFEFRTDNDADLKPSMETHAEGQTLRWYSSTSLIPSLPG